MTSGKIRAINYKVPLKVHPRSPTSVRLFLSPLSYLPLSSPFFAYNRPLHLTHGDPIYCHVHRGIIYFCYLSSLVLHSTWVSSSAFLHCRLSFIHAWCGKVAQNSRHPICHITRILCLILLTNCSPSLLPLLDALSDSSSSFFAYGA